MRFRACIAMFKHAEGATEFSSRRVLEVNDIAERLGYVAPTRIHLNNYPKDNPIAAFNPTMYLDRDYLKVFARIIVGYYMYVSAVALIDIPLDDVLDKHVTNAHYSADIVVYPTIRYDLWGVEDPRVNVIDGDVATMVYTGRCINYFNPAIRQERTLPVVALSRASGNGRKWSKKAAFVFPEHLRSHVVSDKDAFLVKTPDGYLWLFHRPHTDDERNHLVISRVTEDPTRIEGFKEVVVEDTRIILDPAPFELKLGWAAPPLHLGGGRYLVLVHAIEKINYTYNVFAAVLRYEGVEKGFRVEGVSKSYVMGPKMIYEVYGDRPLVVFPCGMVEVDGQILVSYGAADYVVAFAKIDKQQLLSLIEEGGEE